MVGLPRTLPTNVADRAWRTRADEQRRPKIDSRPEDLTTFWYVIAFFVIELPRIRLTAFEVLP
jgi:hypothetical protein